jgi:hypothetical protein
VPSPTAQGAPLEVIEALDLHKQQVNERTKRGGSSSEYIGESRSSFGGHRVDPLTGRLPPPLGAQACTG